MKQLSLFHEPSDAPRSEYWVNKLSLLLQSNGFDGSDDSALQIFLKGEFPSLFMALFQSQRQYIMKELKKQQVCL
jgi:hypothetical protein